MIGKLLRVLSVVAVGIAFSGVARADEHESCDREKLVQSGTFQVHLTRVGFIVGVRWGDRSVDRRDGPEDRRLGSVSRRSCKLGADCVRALLHGLGCSPGD